MTNLTSGPAKDTPHVEGVTFTCSVCGETKPVQTSGGTGYGRDKQDRLGCYQCCGVQDKARMLRDGKTTMYLTYSVSPGTFNVLSGQVSNWPGTLKFPVHVVHRSHHNLARYRYDFWFTCEGQTWHGYQVGDNTQIAHCRRTKA